jgi:hypothetical protein
MMISRCRSNSRIRKKEKIFELVLSFSLSLSFIFFTSEKRMRFPILIINSFENE